MWNWPYHPKFVTYGQPYQNGNVKLSHYMMHEQSLPGHTTHTSDPDVTNLTPFAYSKKQYQIKATAHLYNIKYDLIPLEWNGPVHRQGDSPVKLKCVVRY